jgi:hypothetical protein
MANFKKQKGISVVYIIIAASFIFFIALGINSISSQQSKTMNELGFSTVAFFAADAGAERQLYNLYKETPTSSFNLTFDPYSSSYPAYASTSVMCSTSSSNCGMFTPTSSCSAANFCVNSVGKYKGINRAVELKY